MYKAALWIKNTEITYLLMAHLEMACIIYTIVFRLKYPWLGGHQVMKKGISSGGIIDANACFVKNVKTNQHLQAQQAMVNIEFKICNFSIWKCKDPTEETKSSQEKQDTPTCSASLFCSSVTTPKLTIAGCSNA